MPAGSRSDTTRCVCISCGSKWEKRPGINYSGFETVRREYKLKDGSVNVEFLTSCLCQKCVAKQSCDGQETIDE